MGFRAGEEIPSPNPEAEPADKAISKNTFADPKSVTAV